MDTPDNRVHLLLVEPNLLIKRLRQWLILNR